MSAFVPSPTPCVISCIVPVSNHYDGAMAKKKHQWPDQPEPLEAPVVDNHTHLPVHEGEIPNADGVKISLEQQLWYARAANIEAIITCGCELPDLEPTLGLTADNASVFAALAIHPNEAALHEGITTPSPDGNTPELKEHHQTSLEDAIAEVARLAADDMCVAIGETGLDYFRTSDDGKSAQKKAFREHIALAKELGLPMQIHDREAHEDTISILKKDGAPARTVFHCFSGDASLAKELAENGWYASMAGPVTYSANVDLRDALRVLPRELLLVETDAPYLSPNPWRGCPNASYVMPWTVRCIADEWGWSEARTCNQLRENTEAVYGKLLEI